MDFTFNGKHKRLQDTDLPELGALIDVGEDEIHAFLDVETRGAGFDSKGRIKMLFEPHIFYREIRPDARARAVEDGLAYKKWGTKRYPRDSYPRLKMAMAHDPEAALRSCSWGLGQIMGFNHKLAGYPSAADMVEAFRRGEKEQLRGAINFIEANALDDDLREHDWHGFARGYNGPGYRKNGYAKKLAQAFAKRSEIPDTPWAPVQRQPSLPKQSPMKTPEAATAPVSGRLAAIFARIWRKP